MTPDPPLPPNNPPEPSPSPTPAPARVRGSITCEFCQCTLGPDGNYLKMSDEARAYRDQAETIKQLKSQLADAQAATEAATRDLGTANATISELRGKQARGW